MNNSPNTPAPVRVRIAPSPTGDPHVGTAYIGLINYLFARQRSGKFVLRIEDTDRARFVATSEQEIFNSLRWLGLTWDEGPDVGGPHGPYRQSERTEIYREHVELLLANGTAYRAFENPEELEALRQRQIAAKLPPRYDGAHRDLTQQQIDAYLAEGRPYVVRMKVPQHTSTTFRDELRGDITFDHNNVDDQVLMKSDGFPTYHLANVVDDHLMGITDVIRAEEWISSTPKHVLLYKAFGWQQPRFWHMPLLRNLDKSKISKRKNPVSLIYYRQAGYLPEAMINFLGLMGGGMPAGNTTDTEAAATTQPAAKPASGAPSKSSEADIFTLADMVARFRMESIRLGGPVFDLTKLKWLNGEYLRALTPEAFYTALRSNVLSDAYLTQVAALVQTRIETLAQFGDLTHFFFADDILPTPEVFIPKKRTLEETLAFATDQLAVLEATDWTHDALEPALKKLGEEKQWSVKENFMLLRAIITGSTMSPPLLESMIVFGKSRTLDRVRRFLDTQKKLAGAKK
jgi:glutamyl-tRNA synthetase